MGWLAWLASFHVVYVRTCGKRATKRRIAAPYCATVGVVHGWPGQRSLARCSKATCGAIPAALTAASHVATACGSEVAASHGTVSRA
jgi:hypothetical protein